MSTVRFIILNKFRFNRTIISQDIMLQFTSELAVKKNIVPAVSCAITKRVSRRKFFIFNLGSEIESGFLSLWFSKWSTTHIPHQYPFRSRQGHIYLHNNSVSPYWHFQLWYDTHSGWKCQCISTNQGFGNKLYKHHRILLLHTLPIIEDVSFTY